MTVSRTVRTGRSSRTGISPVSAAGTVTSCSSTGIGEYSQCSLRAASEGVSGKMPGGQLSLGLPRSIVRRRLSDFESPQIRRRTGESVRHIVQDHAAIHRRGAGLKPEIEIIRPVERLNRLQILRIQLWDVHEDVVIHVDAMLILVRGAAV